jgi:hypothetical protein
MIADSKIVQIRDAVTRVLFEGTFGEIRKLIETLHLSGELRAISPFWCCEVCDGSPQFEQIAAVHDGQIWPVGRDLEQELQVGPERTLRTRNMVNYLTNYMPGSAWPGQQKFYRRQGRRAQRRVSKALLQEALLDLE